MGCCGFPGGASGFDPVAFNAAFPSAWWRHTFIPAAVGPGNIGQAGMNGEKSYSSSPNNNEYDYFNFDPNEETIQWATWLWCMPFNWKIGTQIRVKLYWFVTAEGSHGTPVKWQWYVRSIGDGEALQFNETYVNNDDTESANDLLYITPSLALTPGNSGAGLAVNDLFHIMVRRQNDSASGPAKLIGIQINWEIDPTIAVA